MRTIGLNLNGNGWGLVELRGQDLHEKVELTINGTWYSQDSCGRGTELRRVWIENRLPSRAMIALPVLGAIWTTMELPPVTERDILSAVRASLEELQVGHDFWLAYEVLERGDKLKLQVGAIDAQEMIPWLELLDATDIEPDGFILQAQAVSHMIAFDQEPTFFIYGGGTVVEMGVALKGTPMLLRTMSCENQNVEDIRRELTFMRHAWTRQGMETPTKLVTLGDGTELSSIKWEEVWGSDQIQLSKGHDLLNGQLASIAAYGAARLVHGQGIVWHPIFPKIVRRENTQILVMAMISLCLFVLGSFFFYQAHFKYIAAQNIWIKSNLPLYRELDALENQDEQMTSNIRIDKREWESRFRYSQYLEHWQKIVPEETVLAGWNMEGNRVIELTGRTPSIAVLLERLARDDHFRLLAVKGSINHNPKGWDEFRLSGNLAKGAEN